MGVGMLLYLVKHSRQQIFNSVRELSKLVDGTTEAHLKGFTTHCQICHSHRKSWSITSAKLNEDGFYLEGVSVSEFAGDPDTCISVYGSVL
jgi:hypothetical protein